MPTPVTPVEVTPGTPNDWIDVDVTAYVGADAGDLAGVIVEVIEESAGTMDIGVRNNGSTDTYSRVLNTDEHVYFFIGCDGDDIFEAYIESTTNVSIFLLGYVTNAEGSFFTNGIDKSTATTGSWVDVDISGDTGGDTATAACVILKGDIGNTRDYGWRDNDSTDTRVDILNASGLIGGLIGCDSGEIFEQWIVDAGLDLFLVGYLIDNYTSIPNGVQFQAAGTGSYEDVDFSGSIPANNTGATIEYWTDAVISPYGNIKEKGSADDRYYEYTNHTYGWVAIDANREAEQKVEVTTLILYLIGYTSEGAAVRIPLTGHYIGDMTVLGVLSNCWQKIGEGDLGAPASSFTLAGLSGDTDVLYNLILRNIDASTIGDHKLTFNADTGANYGMQELVGSTTTASALRTTGGSFIKVGETKTDDYTSFSDTFIYAPANRVRTLLTTLASDITGATVGEIALIGGVWQDTTTSISQIVVTATADNFEANTHYELWRLNL